MNELALADDPIYDLAIAAGADGKMVAFCARESGIYRSDDAGASWKRVATLRVTAIEVSPSFARDQIVIAGAIGKICRSGDSGDSWEVASLGSPPPLVSCIAFSPSFATDAEIMVGTVDDGVLRSCDGGRTWMPRNTGLFAGHILTIAYSPDYGNDRLVLLGTETDLFQSANGGLSWRDCHVSADGAVVVSISIRDELILAATERGPTYQSHDKGATWDDAGMRGTDVIHVAVHGVAEGWYLGTWVSSDSVRPFVVREQSLDVAGEGYPVRSPVMLAAIAPMQDERRHVLLGLGDGTTSMHVIE